MKALFLIWLAAAASAQQRHLPPPPTQALVPPPDSEESRQRLALEQSVALRKASHSRRNVTRAFVVGSEMHYGLFLVPADARNWLQAEWYMPDFLDEELSTRLAKAANPNGPTLAAHLGQKLLCRCTGVEWSFYGQKRFLIRKAELSWE